MTVHVEDQVTAAQSGRGGGASSYDLLNTNARGPSQATCDARRKRAPRSSNAKPGTSDAAIMQERRDDPAGGIPDRDGEAKAEAGHCSIDAYYLACSVGQRASGVARVEGGIGLDDVLR